MREYIKKIGRISLGILLLLIGVIGGFIPVLQGWVFVLLGLEVLSKDVPFIKKYRDRFMEKYGEKFKQWVEIRAGKHGNTLRFFVKHGFLLLGIFLILIDIPLTWFGKTRGFSNALLSWIYSLTGLGILSIGVYLWKRIFAAKEKPASGEN